jgi:hypothetical protein
MTRAIFSISTIFLVINIFAQGQKDYAWHIKKADSLYQVKEYKSAARTYYKGFLTIEGKAFHGDRYNAACSYSLAEMNDSAFYHLNYMTVKSADYLYNSYTHIIKNDRDLDNIRKDDRWDSFVSRIDSIKAEIEKNLNMDLVNQLDPIYESDQEIRREYRELSEKYERDDPEMQTFFKRWRETDSINEVKVTAILDEHGWLGSDVIGGRGNSTLFLVIQHAPLETQEKYLPMMRQAVKDGNAFGSQLALLEDRIEIRNNRHQIYGSQMAKMKGNDQYVVMPLKDPMNVDKRRAEIGMSPLNDYTLRYGFEWNPEEYVKQLPELEAYFFKNE